MKQLIKRIVLIALCLMLAGVALADSSPYYNEDGTLSEYYFFASNCHFATTSSTTVYADKYLTQPLTTVPKKTFVHFEGDFWPLDMDETGDFTWGANLYTYMLPNGTKGKGWIDSRKVYSAYVCLPDGLGDSLVDIQAGRSPIDVPDSDPVWGDLTEYQTKKKGEKTSASSSSSSTKKATTEVKPWYVTINTEQGTENATLVTLGVSNSVIKVGNENKTVPTKQLQFGDVQLDHTQLIASVLTKKTGFVTIRSEASENAPSIGRIPDGKIVGIVNPGETFTKVSYNGIVGYVVTRGLEFHDVNQEPIGVGTLNQKGKKISIWLEPKTDAKWLAKWSHGEPVTVIAEDGQYYAIEKDGIYGWLKVKYVKLTDE